MLSGRQLIPYAFQPDRHVLIGLAIVDFELEKEDVVSLFRPGYRNLYRDCLIRLYVVAAGIFLNLQAFSFQFRDGKIFLFCPS